MGKHTSIAWANSSLNLVWGCIKVSTECKNCYMYRLSKRYGRDPYVADILVNNVLDVEKRLKGMGKIIFVNSMSDTFLELLSNDLIDTWFRAFKKHPEHYFLILTKRADRMQQYFETRECPDNCWLGISCGISKAKERIEKLRSIKCKVHFVSFEPVLEDLGLIDLRNIQWAIIGGESDYQDPRPMNKGWVTNIIEQCREQNVAVFFKQWGGKGGDGAGGDLYNGRKIQEYPVV